MSTEPEKAGRSRTSSPKYAISAANSKRLVRELLALPRRDADRIGRDIESLAETPRPASSKHLEEHIYRLRCGNWRIIYQVIDEEGLVIVGGIRRRNESTYRRVQKLFK